MKLGYRVFLCLLLFLAACSGPGPGISAPLSTPTLQLAAQTRVPSALPPTHIEPTVAAARAASAAAPTRIAGVSSADQVDQIQEIAHWGKGEIDQLSYSPEGKRLGVATPLGVYIYEADTLKQLDFIPTTAGWPSAIAFDPDWSVMASGNGSTASLLRLADKQEVVRFKTQPGRIIRLLFSPDGQYLACLIRPPGEEVYTYQMELRRASDGELLGSWEAGALPEAAFSADSRAFYAWNAMRMQEVRGWQIPSGKPLDIANYPAVESMTFSTQGRQKWVAVLKDANHILLQQASESAVVRTLEGENITGPIQLSPDGALLAAFRLDRTVQVWRVTDGKPLFNLSAANGQMTYLTFSPDGQTLILPAWDGLDFYRMKDGKLDRHLGSHFNRITQAVLSPQGHAAAALVSGQADQSSLVVWGAPDGQVIQQTKKAAAIALTWSPDGSDLALGEWGGRIRVLRAETGSEVLNWPTQTEQVQSVAYSPDGKLLASSSMSVIDIWRAVDGTLLKRLKVPGGWANSLKFSPNGARLAALTGDGSVRVWQVPASPGGEWLEAGQFPSSNYADSAILDFTQDGQWLVIGEPAVANPPTQVWLWRIGEQKPTLHIPIQKATLVTLRLSPDGSLLACGLTDGTIQLFRISDGTWLRTLAAGAVGIASLDYSADGQLLLSASWDGTLHLWKHK